MRKFVPVLLFIATVVAANWAIATFPPIPLGWGLVAPAGTLFAAAAFILRDAAQTAVGARWTIGAVLSGALLSAWLASPGLAIASAAAFAAAELVDMAVFTVYAKRSWVGARITSNVVGSLVDTLVFLSIAGQVIPFLALSWSTFTGQFLLKAAIGTVVVLAYRTWRSPAPATA